MKTHRIATLLLAALLLVTACGSGTDIPTSSGGGDSVESTVDTADTTDDGSPEDSAEANPVDDNPKSGTESLAAAIYEDWPVATKTSNGCIADSGIPGDLTRLKVPPGNEDFCDGLTAERLENDEIEALIKDLDCPGNSVPTDGPTSCPYNAIAALKVSNDGNFANDPVEIEFDFSPSGVTSTHECETLAKSSSTSLDNNSQPTHGCDEGVTTDESASDYQIYRVDGGKWDPVGTARMGNLPKDEVIFGTVTHFSTIVLVRLPEAQLWFDINASDVFTDEAFEVERRLVNRDYGFDRTGKTTLELPFLEVDGGYLMHPEGDIDMIVAFQGAADFPNGSIETITVTPEEILVGGSGELRLLLTEIQIHVP